jgi:hypothetical protein
MEEPIPKPIMLKLMILVFCFRSPKKLWLKYKKEISKYEYAAYNDVYITQ